MVYVLLSVFPVRTCKEAKRKGIAKSISAAIARTEQLENDVQDQRARKAKLATLISQQLLSKFPYSSTCYL